MSFPQWHQSDFKRECLSCQIPGTQGMARGLRAQPTALQQDPRGPARGKTCFKSIHPLTFSCSPVLVFSCSHVLMFMFSCSHVLSWQEERLASNPYTLILLRRAHGLPNDSFIPNTHITRVQEIEGGKRPCSGTLFLRWKNNAMQETKGGEHHLGEHLGHHLGEHLGPTPGRLSGAVGQNHPGDEKTCQKTIFCPGSDLRPTSSSSKNVCASYLFTSLLIHRLPPPRRSIFTILPPQPQFFTTKFLSQGIHRIGNRQPPPSP